RLRRPPSSPLFPYTTLFRSQRVAVRRGLRDRFGRGDAGGAGTILDERLLRKACAQLGRDEPRQDVVAAAGGERHDQAQWLRRVLDRKSTRLNSSHVSISYAV